MIYFPYQPPSSSSISSSTYLSPLPSIPQPTPSSQPSQLPRTPHNPFSSRTLRDPTQKFSNMPHITLPKRLVVANSHTTIPSAEKTHAQKSKKYLLATLLAREARLQSEITETRLRIERVREERLVHFKGEDYVESDERHEIELDRESKEMKRREEYRRDCEAFSKRLEMGRSPKMGIGRSASSPVKKSGVVMDGDGGAERRASGAGVAVGKGWRAVSGWYADWLEVVAKKA